MTTEKPLQFIQFPVGALAPMLAFYFNLAEKKMVDPAAMPILDNTLKGTGLSVDYIIDLSMNDFEHRVDFELSRANANRLNNTLSFVSQQAVKIVDKLVDKKGMENIPPEFQLLLASLFDGWKRVADYLNNFFDFHGRSLAIEG